MFRKRLSLAISATANKCYSLGNGRPFCGRPRAPGRSTNDEAKVTCEQCRERLAAGQTQARDADAR